MRPIGFAHHDHSRCIRESVDAAAAHCAAEGLQFTPIRRRVLEILLAHHRALGAYDILEILREEGHAAQPPVAYRALDFLTGHGFAHRIEALNAFIACHHVDGAHNPVFLICTDCRKVAEADADPVHEGMERASAAAGFRLDHTVIEATGLCPDCARGGRA